MKVSVGKQLVKQAPQYEQVVHLTLTESEARSIAARPESPGTDDVSFSLIPNAGYIFGADIKVLRALKAALREAGY